MFLAEGEECVEGGAMAYAQDVKPMLKALYSRNGL